MFVVHALSIASPNVIERTVRFPPVTLFVAFVKLSNVRSVVLLLTKAPLNWPPAPQLVLVLLPPSQVSDGCAKAEVVSASIETADAAARPRIRRGVSFVVMGGRAMGGFCLDQPRK